MLGSSVVGCGAPWENADVSQVEDLALPRAESDSLESQRRPFPGPLITRRMEGPIWHETKESSVLTPSASYLIQLNV